MANQPTSNFYRWRGRLFFGWLGAGLMGMLALAKIASAQTAGLGNLSNAGVNLGNQDLITTIAKIINIGLGVLGVVAVLLIIYAGFIWLTSQGNEEKIAQAKKILSSAVIGLVIILASLAVATFIINKIIGATGGASTEPPLTVCADGSAPPCAGGFDRLQVTSTSPRHQEEGVKLCRRVQGQFNEKLDPGTVKASTIKIVDTKNTSIISDDEAVGGTYNVADKSFSFRHADFAADRRYQATVFSGSAGVKDIRSRSLREDKKWYFTTGTETDSVLPQVISVYPAVSSTEACRSTPIQAVFSEEMDSTTLNKQNIILQDASGTVIPLSDVEVGSDFKSVTVYAASQLSSRTAYTVTLKSGPSGLADACGNQLDGNKNNQADNTPADDYKWTFTTDETVECKPVLETLAPVSGYYGDLVTLTGKNLALTGEVLFNNWPADSHSFNNTSNIVCWGAGTCPSNTVTVKVPVGMFPGDNKQVAVKVKIGRETSDGKNFSLLSPVVRALNPDRGPIGQFVTIFGWNFGTDKGTVKFGDKIAEPACADGSWTDREIVVKVPLGLNLGDYELQVITAAAKPSNLQNFIVNSSQLAPGLCSLLPQCSASGGGKITEIKGVRFGVSRGSSTVGLDNNKLVPTGAWSDSLIKDTPLPATLNDGSHMVRVIVNQLASNAKTYDVPCTAASYPEVIEDSTCELSSQSPSPAKDNKEACKNSLISVRFSEPMASASLSAANIKLKKCNNADTFAATACVDSGVTNLSYLTDQESSTVVGLAAEPTNALASNYWYQATITTGATSLAGVGLRVPYTWQWRVRSDNSDCAINKVMCQPKTGFIRSITAPANTKNYSAAAVAANCNLLNNQNLNWSWSSSDNTKATVLPASPNQTALVTAVNWTGNNGPVNIKARLDSANKEASCDLYISGTACRESSQCRACGAGLSACVSNNCTPVITGFSPPDGANGTWNSINGCYFGDEVGNVLYAKNGQTVEGLWPRAELCGKTWSNRQIVSEVPPLATTGLFKVVRPPAAPGEAVSTQPFTVNNVNYPGLCKISPAYVYESDLGTNQAKVEVYGKGLGDSQQGGDKVKYYKSDGITLSTEAFDYSEWTEHKIVAKTPLGTAIGRDKVAVRKSGVVSNKINFSIYAGSSAQKAPVITSLTPDSGMARADITTTFITIKGENFGDSGSSGQVLLRAQAASSNWLVAKVYDFNNDKALTQADVDLLTGKIKADINYEQEQEINGKKVKVKINEPFNVNNDGTSKGKIDADDKKQVVDYLAAHPYEHDIDYVIKADAGCSWSDKEVVAKVPTTVNLGEAWQVKIRTSGGISTQNNFIFTVNDIVHPGICKLTPDHGQAGTQVVINGLNFGDVKSNSILKFPKAGGQVVVEPGYIKSWRGSSITLAVPDKEAGTCVNNLCPIQIKTGEVRLSVHFPDANGGWQESNPVTFIAEPYISSITPLTAPAGSWVTIKGGNFGDCPTRGTNVNTACTVIFSGSNDSQVLESSLPAICSNTWKDNQIIVKVPSGGTTSLVKVRNLQGLLTSNSASKIFTYNNNLPLPPGLCKLSPQESATLPVAVALQGDNFGATPGAKDSVQFSNQNFTNTVTSLSWSSWNNNAINITVPTGTITGDVYVRRQQRQAVGIKCNGVAIGGKCIGSEETLYQDKDVISNPMEFTITDKPKVVSVLPVNNQTNVCRNAVIAVTFDHFLGSASPLTPDKFVVKSVCTGVGCQASLVTGSLKTVGTKLYFTPTALLAPLTKYEVELVGDKIICNNNCQWQFTTRDKACTINQVPVAPAQHTFTKPGADGETIFAARALANDGQELAANFSWKNPASNIVTYQGGTQSAAVLVQATKNNGSTLLTVEADGTAWQAGKKTGQAEVEVFICDFPWEFSDPDEGFSLRYCRGNLTDPADKRLPELSQPTPPYARHRGDLLGEYFFRVASSGDVFGLRVYKNLNRFSPRDWYDSRTDIVQGNPQSFGRVDGYEAIKDGNSYYVGAVKQVDNRLYTNIYVLSFNQGATGIAGQIADKLLSGWKFNLNVSDAGQLAALKRDIIRLNDLALLKLSLNNYKAANGDYPVLTAGTFVAGLTASVWPSWQATLGNALGVAAPTDPLNNFLDGAGNNMCSGSGYESFDAATCWNALSQQFKCPDGSHIYQYRYAGGRAYLYANFEYKNVVWPGTQAGDTVTIGDSQSCHVATVAPTLILD